MLTNGGLGGSLCIIPSSRSFLREEEGSDLPRVAGAGMHALEKYGTSCHFTFLLREEEATDVILFMA